MAGNDFYDQVDDFANDVRIVRLIDGDETAYRVHASHLVTSKAITTRLSAKTNTSASENALVRLDIRYSKHFNHYINWLYKGYLAPDPPTGPLLYSNDDDIVQIHYQYLKSLYLLAVEVEDSTFQDAAIDALGAKIAEAMIAVHHVLPPAELIKEFSDRTPPENNLRERYSSRFS